jgi:hypothetical protein
MQKHQTIAVMIFDFRGGAEIATLSVSRTSRVLGVGVHGAGCNVSIGYGASKAV